MTILFAGGEMEDFVLSGSASVSTSAANFRSTYARQALTVSNGTGTLKASITASSSFSVTGRFYVNSGFAAVPFVWVATGGSARLRLRPSGTSNPTTIVLEKVDSGGTATTLATSASTLAANGIYRLDWIIDYQASGRVRVFIDQTSYIDYSGDVTASGATTLDSVNLSGLHTTFTTFWSEVIVSTQDSRTLSLATLAPNAAGTTTGWTSGAYTDIDETTASDSDVLTSATANQVFQANLSNLLTTSGVTVAAVKVLALAARGSTGPSKLAVGVRTNSTDSYPTSVTLDTGYSAAAATYYQTNPVTSAAWTTSEVDALQISLRSET